jgi:hypothetical protein
MAEREQERRKIERAYQRAMNIRDSTPCNYPWPITNKNEQDYVRAYKRAYKSGSSEGFTAATRRYLRTLRTGEIANG